MLNTTRVHDNTQGNGPPLVELLSLSSDLGVIGRTITVFDGKRGQIIYSKEEQGVEKGIYIYHIYYCEYKVDTCPFGSIL